MRTAKEGVALTIEIQATVVAAGDADPTASTITVAVRKWKQGDGEDGYYYTGTAWQVGAATVTSAQKDAHAHEVVVDATRMGSLAGFDLSARPSSATAIGPTTWVHVLDDFETRAVGDLSNLDVAVSTRATPANVTASESNIRGTDSDDLKTLSDQLDDTATFAEVDAVAAAVWDEILTGGTHNIPSSAGRRLRAIENVEVLREEEFAQAGSTGSLTLHADSSSVDDFYNHTVLVLVDGLGTGQVRSIQTYIGSTRVANIVPDWEITPDGTTKYIVMVATEVHAYEVHAPGIQTIRDAILSDGVAFDGANIDIAVSTRATPVQVTAVETNIRGVDSDDLKSLSDQLDDLKVPSEGSPFDPTGILP